MKSDSLTLSMCEEKMPWIINHLWFFSALDWLIIHVILSSRTYLLLKSQLNRNLLSFLVANLTLWDSLTLVWLHRFDNRKEFCYLFVVQYICVCVWRKNGMNNQSLIILFQCVRCRYLTRHSVQCYRQHYPILSAILSIIIAFQPINNAIRIMQYE